MLAFDLKCSKCKQENLGASVWKMEGRHLKIEFGWELDDCKKQIKYAHSHNLK